MKLKEKIFNAFEVTELINSSSDALLDIKDSYTYSDPFDFYRISQDPHQYVPKTQRGLLKAFSEGLIGIEFFLEMATSLRPLADEAQDIDEITRLFSQQKLSSRPNPHSVEILRNMLKEENPEIALYAAEGLNSIENGFISKIQRVKDKIKKGRGKLFIQYYILGKLYMEFAKLLEGQHLIQNFYLKESLNYLKEANSMEKKNYRIYESIGEIHILLKNYSIAIKIFQYLYNKNRKNINYLMKLAECYYGMCDYKKVRAAFKFVSKESMELDEISELVVYQWIL